jgi:hypothetical protein
MTAKVTRNIVSVSFSSADYNTKECLKTQESLELL